jgi:pimeloyl-ACP methyl ester carboxylesterase
MIRSNGVEAEYLQVGGSLAFVEQTGAGTPVLCLHTAGQSGVQWRHVTGELAALGYRAVVPDLPGHGRSEPAVGGPVTDLGFYAAWCVELIELLGLKRPFVVGCSIGGKTALDIARRIPDRISGVVAMAADAWTGGRPSVRGLRRELSDVAAPSRSDRTYLGTLAVVGQSVSPQRAELIATMHRREDPAVSTSDLIGWTTHDLRADLPSITCPAHLVVGADDLWVDADAVRRAAAQIPGARMTVLPGIGHYPMEEIDGFAALLDRWLRALIGAGTGTLAGAR